MYPSALDENGRKVPFSKVYRLWEEHTHKRKERAKLAARKLRKKRKEKEVT